MKNGKWKMENLVFFTFRSGSTLRSVVTLSGPDQSFIRHTTQLNANRAKFSITLLIGWIIAQTVLRPDLSGHACEGSARVLKTVGNEVPAAAVLCQIVHLLAGQIVKIAADRHSLKRSHRTKVHVVFSLCARVKNVAIPL